MPISEHYYPSTSHFKEQMYNLLHTRQSINTCIANIISLLSVNWTGRSRVNRDVVYKKFQ
jgi:hypothetical protein